MIQILPENIDILLHILITSEILRKEYDSVSPKIAVPSLKTKGLTCM